MTAPVSGTSGAPITVSGLSGKPISGLAMMIWAFAKSYEVVQKYNIAQMQLGSSLQQTQAEVGAKMIKDMQDGPLKEMQKISHDKDDKEKGNKISVETGKLNTANATYNQEMAVYNGLISGVNQSSSDTTQTLQTNLQMMGTNGILSIMQTVTQILA